MRIYNFFKMNISIFVISLFVVSCGGGGSSNSSIIFNSKPDISNVPKSYAFTEKNGIKTIDLLKLAVDKDADTLYANVDSSTILENYLYIKDSKLFINTDLLDVKVSENKILSLKILVSDSKDISSYTLKIVFQDKKEDSLMTGNFEVPEKIYENTNFQIKLNLKDEDFMNNSYENIIKVKLKLNEVAVKELILYSTNTFNNTLIYESAKFSLGMGNYQLETKLKPLVNGINPQTDLTIFKFFTVQKKQEVEKK